jgi:hypothetical protein
MITKKHREELGDLLYDSHPKIFILFIILLLGSLIGFPLFYGLIIYDQVVSFIGFLIFVFIWAIFGPFAFIHDKYRFKIYENGIMINVYKYAEDPSKTLIGDEYNGKRYVEYKFIVSLHPFASKFGEGKHLKTIGLQIVLPKEKNNFIAGNFSFSGKRMENMQEVVNFLKIQMGPLWKDKYKKDEAISIGDIDPNKIGTLVEVGENP